MQPSLPFPEFKEPRGPIRRRVYRLRPDPLPSGAYVFKAKSFSRRVGLAYRCYVNPKTGSIYCSCRDFKFRKGRVAATYPAGPACKHLQRAIRTVKRLQKLSRQKRDMAA